MIRHLTAFKGKGKKFIFTIYDNDGNFVNLAGKVGKINIFLETPNVEDNILLTKNLTNVDNLEGTASVEFNDTEMNLNAYQYKYNITYKYATDNDRVLQDGDFIITGDDVNNRIKQIKTTYGLNYEHYILKKALEYARKEVSKNGYQSVKTDTGAKKAQHKICKNVMDINNDGIVNEDDFNVYQYMKTSPYTVEDLNAHITSINLDNPTISFITLDADYPSDGYTLRIEYYIGSSNKDDIQSYIDKLEVWYVLQYLFENLEPFKLQHDMSTKDINGISVTFDQQGIRDFQKQIDNKLMYYKMKVLPFSKCEYNNAGTGGLFGNVLIPKSYS